MTKYDRYTGYKGQVISAVCFMLDNEVRPNAAACKHVRSFQAPDEKSF